MVNNFCMVQVPDWISQEMLDLIADDKARCMKEHGTTQGTNDSNAFEYLI